MGSNLWSLPLSPKKATTYVPGRDLKLTNIALGHHLVDESTIRRTSVTLRTRQTKPTTICSLVPTRVEQVVTDVVLTRGQEVTFEINGNNPVHLTGYFVGPEMKAEYFEREVGTGRPVSAGCTASINLLMRKMDGTVIEDTRSGNKGEPLDLDLSAPTTTGIMQALRDGLLGMKQGGARKIVVPPNLAKFEHDGVPVSVEGLLPDDVVILEVQVVKVV